MSTTLHIENKNALVPELRFKEFSEDSLYEKYSFKDIFQFSTGKNIKQNEASPDFETPCVRYGELYHMYNEVIYNVINKTSLDKSELHFSKGDEILLPSAGEDPLDIGSASALTIENIAIGRTINILRPIMENVYSQIYASYYINHKLKKKISKLAKGSSISNVYNSDLKTLEIILPDFSEQQKTATFLSAVDEKIQQLSRKKELLSQYKKGVMQQLFSGKLRFKDENGEDYADWEDTFFADTGKILIGLTHTPEYQPTGRPFLSSKNISGAFIDYNNIQYISEEKFQSMPESTKPKKGDILFTRVGSNLGNPKVIEEDIEFGIFVSLGVFRVNEKASNYFMRIWMDSDYFWRQLEQKVAGGAKNNLNTGWLKEFKLNLPSFPEQQKIADFLSSIDTKIESTSQQINQTQSFKKGLLQQLFV